MFVQDALKLLVLARTIKNIFAPINRVPPEILSLISDYCSGDELVALTHVCRSWREIFISRPSSWGFLDCLNLDRTRTYLERSKTSLLEIRVETDRIHHDVFLVAISHTRRLKALTLSGSSHSILVLTRHIASLVSPAPLLEKLEICVRAHPSAAIQNTLFEGDLRSLRELRLVGVITDMPWRNLSNLQTFHLRLMSARVTSVTRLLDFFEHAPLLREIKLMDCLPGSSDAPAVRVVSLPRLRLLGIAFESAHSVLLNHLRIPTGASVTLEVFFEGYESPLLNCLPRSLDNLDNISHITSVHLNFGSGINLRLEGPSGDLCITDSWDHAESTTPIHSILLSLNSLPISTTKRFTIAHWDASVRLYHEWFAACQTLRLMNDIRTLTLTDCSNLSLFIALNPYQATNSVLCPELEELVLCTQARPDDLFIVELLEMVKGRASWDVGLSSFVIECPLELGPLDKLFGLRSYVEHVEHRLDSDTPGMGRVAGCVCSGRWD